MPDENMRYQLNAYLRWAGYSTSAYASLLANQPGPNIEVYRAQLSVGDAVALMDEKSLARLPRGIEYIESECKEELTRGHSEQATRFLSFAEQAKSALARRQGIEPN